MSTTREAILTALAELLLRSGGFFPEAVIDEPEPSRWTPLADQPAGAMKILHAVAVQDGPPPERLAFVRGGEADPTDELELEAAIAYGVRVEIGAGQTQDDVRRARRALRDEAVDLIAALVAGDRTLGLGCEVWAEVGPVQRDDDVAFQNASAVATAVIPIRVLYTAAHAAG